MADVAGQLCEDSSSAITDLSREFDLVILSESKSCICSLSPPPHSGVLLWMGGTWKDLNHAANQCGW